MDSIIRVIQDVSEEISGHRPLRGENFNFLDSLEYLDMLLEVERRTGISCPSGSYPDFVGELAEILEGARR